MQIRNIALSAVLACTVALAGCAGTPYQPHGFTGGFSEEQLDTNVFKVSFSANGYTSATRVARFTLTRCAELTLENGYRFFQIIDADSDTQISSYTTSTQINTIPTGSGGYSNYTTGGNTYIISKPSASNLIVMFVERPTEGFSYNAQFIWDKFQEAQ